MLTWIRNVCFNIRPLATASSPRSPVYRYIFMQTFSFVYLFPLYANIAPQTNVSIFPSTEFVLDTCPAPSVLQTHSLQEWGLQVVVYRLLAQAAHVFFAPIRVCDASEDSSNLQKQSSKTCVSALIFVRSAHSWRNFVPASKLIRWWEVP